jgi:hypothetical protein
MPVANAASPEIELSIVLDTNVFNFIRQKPESEPVKLLVAFAKLHGLILDPSFALIEQRLRHGNPDSALTEYRDTLQESFGITVSDGNVKRMIHELNVNKPALEYNVALLRDYLPLIKQIWNSQKSFEKQVSILADRVMSDGLPKFTFAFLFAVVAFFVKNNKALFSEKEFSKVQSDMAISPKSDKEEDRLWNVAHDLALFNYCIEASLWDGSPELHVSTIASADISFPIFCRNIKCALLEHRLDTTGKISRLGHVGLFPGGDLSDEQIKFAMEKVPCPGSESVETMALRRENLAALAKQIVNNRN